MTEVSGASDRPQGLETARQLRHEGDLARDFHDWRDALRKYQDALWSLSRHTQEPDRLRRSLYARIGELQLRAQNEAEIARGYYEAALALSTTHRQRVTLLCRIAETYRRSPEALKFVEEAARLAANSGDDLLRDWVAFRRAETTPHVSHAERCRVLELGRAVLTNEAMPEAWREQARRSALAHAGELLDESAIMDQARQLARREDRSWITANHQYAVADGLRRVGKLREAIDHAQRAAQIYRALGRTEEEAGAEVAMAGYQVGLSDIVGAIDTCRTVLSKGPSTELRRQALLTLSETWIHAPTEEAVEYSRLALVETVETADADEAAARLALHDVGSAERALRGAGVDVAALIEQTGSPLPWQGSPVDTPEPPPPANLRRWREEPGSDRGAVSGRGTDVLLDAVPHKGFVRLDVPRLMARVQGDFILQARIHGGNKVLDDLRRCREAAARGERTEGAAGAGGLVVVRDLHQALRLAAHVREPGEVLAEIRQGTGRRTIGRAWIGDRPAALRIEKRGQLLRLLAGTSQGWQELPPIVLDDWDHLDVGVFGECPTDMYPVVASCTTRFADVALEGELEATSTLAAATAVLSPRPTPTIRTAQGLLSNSAAIEGVLEQVCRIADSASPVLICGETGTGKELIARALHANSNRMDRPFIAVNCAAVSGDLLERELFGHVRGAYTGANESRGGLFEAADGGTLFLDEIGEASIDLQLRLLRVVEEQAVRPVGSSRHQPIDVRIVSATNEDLEQAIGDRRFRADLYYRLRGARICLPSLRRRPEDIPVLAYHALDLRFRDESHPGISEEAMAALVSYPWPGNVRELLNEVQEAASLAPDEMLRARHLSITATTRGRQRAPTNGDRLQRLTDALRQADGNVSQAARLLQVSRSTMYRWMRIVGLR